jgi:Tol biopolymer transport system component
VFTPDNSRVAYTEGGNTWIVSIHGGLPSLLLPNAAGLSWIDELHVLFSEHKSGIHMGVVTATQARADKREIYFPEHQRAMAHYSYPSPDHKWLLVVEMDGRGILRICEVVPFDKSSSAKVREVGPPGTCTAAAWSPDGAWMYFSVGVQGSWHLWRQRFSGGAPEQITFGPTTEERGVAVAPDGASLVTSVGRSHSTLWIHDASGERPLSSQGLTSRLTRVTSDGKRVYYLSRQSPATNFSELRVLDLATGRSDHALPGVSVRDFDISHDEREIAYTTEASDGISEIWLAPLDHHEPAHRVTRGGDGVSFGAGDELIFRSNEATMNFLTRVRKDGTGRARAYDAPLGGRPTVSPDGAWAFLGRTAIPLAGGKPRPICQSSFCFAAWSPDGRFLYLDTKPESEPGRTLVFPLAKGQSFPDLPAGVFLDQEEARALPGVVLIPHTFVAPGLSPSTYVFVKSEFLGNLFQIPLH